MELTHFKYFVMLASVLNFTEAARRLFITQSTLSQSIKHTEEYLGVPLFERIGKKVFLTDAGNAFLPYAQKVLTEAEKGVQIIRDLQGVNAGVLKVGVISGLRNMLIPAIIEFAEKYPDIRLKLHHSSSARELAALVLEDKIDMALTFLPGKMSPLLDYQVLFQSQLKIMTAKADMQNCDSMSLKEIEQKPIVLPPMGTYIRTIIDELAMRYKLNIQPCAETNDSMTLIQMVRTGKWISIGTDTSISQNPDLSGITIEEPTPPIHCRHFTAKNRIPQSSHKKSDRIDFQNSRTKSLNHRVSVHCFFQGMYHT